MIASIQFAALPAGGAANQFIGRPIVLVELERDYFGGAVPGDGAQPQRGPVRAPLYGLDEGIEIRRGPAVDFDDAPACEEVIARSRRPVGKVRDEHAVWRNAPLLR